MVVSIDISDTNHNIYSATTMVSGVAIVAITGVGIRIDNIEIEKKPLKGRLVNFFES